MTAEQLATIADESEERTPLPEGWRLVRLGDVCDVQLGKMLSPASKTGKGSRPYLRNANVQWNHFNLSDVAEMDFSQHEEKKFALAYGDLLVCEGGEPGRAAVWEEQIKPCFYQKALHRVRPLNDLIEPKFLMYRLWLGAAGGEFVDSHAQTTIAHLPAVRLIEFVLAVPQIEEQRRIATVLDEQMKAVEQARRAVEEQIEAAKLLPGALLRSVFEGDEARKWRKTKLGEVCDIVAKQVDPKAERYATLPHISSENIEGKTCRLLFVRTAKEDNITSGNYLFTKGEVLYSKIRPYLRKALVTESDGVCSADIYPIQVNPDYLDPHFLAWVLVSDEFTAYADDQSRRARMPKLNREQLFSWSISLPSVEEQREIIKTLNVQMQKVEQLAKTLTEQLEAIEKMPAALLRKAFAGEV